MRDLDWSDVYNDAMNDPTLDRDCEEGYDCDDKQCPLVHPAVLVSEGVLWRSATDEEEEAWLKHGTPRGEVYSLLAGLGLMIRV